MVKKTVIKIIMIIALLGLYVSCQGDNKAKSGGQSMSEKKGESKMETLEIKSPAFSEGEMIPAKYTCDGQNVSVPLSWSEVPDSAKSLALTCEDPDAPSGNFVHWLVINMPSDITELAENIRFSQDSSLAGTIECQNTPGHARYDGPCPPRGATHRYFFKLYALDSKLDLSSKATSKDVAKAMQGHILGQGQLMGKYSRQAR